MSRRVRNWCDVCRDTEPDLKCVVDGCGKQYHVSCLRNADLVKADEEIVRDSFVCPDCQDSNLNDNICYICNEELIKAEKRRSAKKKVVEEEDTDVEEEEDEVQPRRSARQRAAAENASTPPDPPSDRKQLKKSELADATSIDFVMCDGCSHSAHLRCLGLQSVPQEGDEEMWFCPECDPNGATATEMAKTAANKRVKAAAAGPTKSKIGGNVDICYVCQKFGRLLGCDFCEQSFHPRCIDGDFLEFEETCAETETTTEAQKWRCPICRGEDPLKNMGHKRLSRTAMIKLSKQWQDCIKTTHKACRLNRDTFLWHCRRALVPFVAAKTMARLRKTFGQERALPDKKRRKGVVADDDEDTQSEDSDDQPEAQRRREDIQALKTFRATSALAEAAGQPLLKEGVSLKSYQMVGVGWLLEAFHNKAGAILADEMGLGKTIQCLTFVSGLKAKGITGPHLIVVPLSTVGNWAREIRKFVPHLKFVKICGSRFERDHIMADSTASNGLYDLYITTYETVVTEEAFFCDNFAWQCLILDEAHRIKNESGRIRHSLDRVSATMRVLLTGTPLQNNVKELFTLLNFLFPDVLKDSATFEKVFARKEDVKQQPTPELEDVFDETAVSAVSQLLGKMMLRRTKDLVVRLPKKIEHDLWLPLSPAAAYWYRKLLDVSEAAFQQQSVKKLLGTVVKMRICCCHPRGLVTRDSQLSRFREVFSALEPEEEARVTVAAQALRDLHGEEHILASSKLTFLDKLLTQLHCQNLEASSDYKREFMQNVKDIFILKHPPAELPKPPPPRRTKTAAPKSEQIAVPDAATPADSDPPASEPPPVKDEPTLTNRQQAERMRKERLAATVAQMAETEKELERAAQEALDRLQPTAEDRSLFWDFMLPATVDDAPLPTLPGEEENEDQDAEESANGDEQEEEEEDDAKAATKEIGPADEEALSQPPVPDEAAIPNKAPQRVQHKVLIFTQFQLVLDELEEYCQYRGFKYLRLDGSTNKMIRELDIRDFNSPQSTHLLYLICTRAGGVGINLVTANHVILYDEDWNPFIDLQAIDRAHRIGQKRDVHVWKLITEWTVEERMAFRRMQKLKLDRLLIQANAETAVHEDEGASEKFSVEEIKRLIRHGRTAILRASEQGQSLANKPLEAIIQRERQQLPIETDEMDDAEATDPDDEGPIVSLAEALDPEDAAACLGQAQETNTVGITSRTASTDDADTTEDVEKTSQGDVAEEPSGQDITTLEDARKSRRLRRRVPQYRPPSPERLKIRVERKVVHEKKCFRCGSGNNALDENADPLIPCHRCPKVYHMAGCLEYGAPPKKTWSCPWHECCLCFRKGSQAGGLLIHCAECPTTFCFDCFPPEYRRYTPPATYFAELVRRGYRVSADKLVLFLCSRCKALKEQARRRLLSRQQLEAEMRKRREANMKARVDAQKVKGGDVAKEPPKRSADSKKAFSAKKKLIDDQDKEIITRIREAYEKLFPAEFLEVLQEKRQAQLAAIAVKTNEVPTPAADAPPTDRRTLKGIPTKLPSEFCKLCDNCHLPSHESHLCPFPAETEKKALPMPLVEPSPGETEEAKQNAKTVNSKRQVKSLCPKCGVSSRNHFRRHCDDLTEEETAEYESRRALIGKFLELLEKAERVPLPPAMKPNVSNAESCRRSLQRRVDYVLSQCLVEAGLERCVQSLNANKAAALANNPSRRKRKPSDGDVSPGDDSDDDNYSPHKRLEEGGTLGPDGLSEQEAIYVDDVDGKRGRRRPRPNFRELAGGTTNSQDEEDEEEEPQADSELRTEAPRLLPAKPPTKRARTHEAGAAQKPLTSYLGMRQPERRPSLDGHSVSRLPPPADNRLPPSRWTGQPLASGPRITPMPGTGFPPTAPWIYGYGTAPPFSAAAALLGQYYAPAASAKASPFQSAAAWGMPLFASGNPATQSAAWLQRRGFAPPPTHFQPPPQQQQHHHQPPR